LAEESFLMLSLLAWNCCRCDAQIWYFLNTLEPAEFRFKKGSLPKLAKPLQLCNSPVDCARELFKPSKTRRVKSYGQKTIKLAILSKLTILQKLVSLP